MFWKNKTSSVFERDLESFLPRLRRYCLTLTGNRDRADDLAQMSCLRAIEKSDLFQPGTKLDQWMFKLTQRVWLNEIRANVVRQRGSMLAIDEIDIPDNKPNPEEHLFAQQIVNQVMKLPEAQRVTVILAYVEGFSYQETSDILDIPIGTVMSRLAAARVKLTSQSVAPRKALS